MSFVPPHDRKPARLRGVIVNLPRKDALRLQMRMLMQGRFFPDVQLLYCPLRELWAIAIRV